MNSLCFILEFWHIMYVRSNFFRKFNLYFIVNRTLPLLKSQSFPISLNRSSIWNNGIIIVYILVIIHYPQNKKFLAVWAIYTCIRKTNRVKYIPSDIKTEKYFRVLVKKFDLTIDCMLRVRGVTVMYIHINTMFKNLEVINNFLKIILKYWKQNFKNKSFFFQTKYDKETQCRPNACPYI